MEFNNKKSRLGFLQTPNSSILCSHFCSLSSLRKLTPTQDFTSPSQSSHSAKENRASVWPCNILESPGTKRPDGCQTSPGTCHGLMGLTWAMGFQEKVGRAGSELCYKRSVSWLDPQGWQRGQQHDVPSVQVEETRDDMGPAYPQSATSSILTPLRPSAAVCLGCIGPCLDLALEACI